MPRRTNSKPTLKDVADLAGVSAQTVSFVVNHNPVITAETRQRVLAAIQQLGYTPNASARSLRSGHSQVLGLLIPDGHNPHFWAILDGAEQEALANGYSLVVATTAMQKERERKAFDALTRQHLAGLILLLTFPEDFSQDVALLRKKNLPIVVDGQQFEQVDRVWFHYRPAARELMDHLFALGHRRIALIQGVGRQDHSAGKDRADVYLQKMSEQGVPQSEQRIEPCGSTLEEGFAAAQRILAADPETTAIVGMNDLIAYGAMQAAQQAGLRVPQDLSIAGFDDDAMFRLLTPALTTGRVDGEEFGAKAVRLILNRLQTPELSPQKAHASSRLVVRQSTGPARVAVTSR
jgi:DNA-binding LacI/PurR family transcriptional regulator